MTPLSHLTAEELLPCPFCRGAPQPITPYGPFERTPIGEKVDHGDFIICVKCGANIYRGNSSGSTVEERHAELTAAWNRRAATTAQGEAEGER